MDDLFGDDASRSKPERQARAGGSASRAADESSPAAAPPASVHPAVARLAAAQPALARLAAAQPLAERMRPRSFEEWIGQRNATGPGSPLRRLLAQKVIPSLILWGPPGCGKTTLARLIAHETGLRFQPLSAVTSGIKEAKEVIDLARHRLNTGHGRTLLFIDEIHRFNKAQQDAFLPHVENGTIILIGATTENPSFSVIAPLLSRSRVITLSSLTIDELVEAMRRALADRERGLGEVRVQVDDDVLRAIAGLSDGDARRALNTLEQAVGAALGEAAETADAESPPAESAPPPRLTMEALGRLAERDRLFYDKAGEEHFNLISAFHKSMRASDPQGALFWMARMLEAGEDPLWILRRVIACAAEDVGLADPQALVQAVSAFQAFQQLGRPEGELPMTQAVVYVATAPKSNAVIVALNAVREAARAHAGLGVPLHLRNAPTGLMKQLGYGREYQYDHDAPEHFSGQPCLPEELSGSQFYEPGEFGFERDIKKRLDWWAQRRKEREDS